MKQTIKKAIKSIVLVVSLTLGIFFVSFVSYICLENPCGMRNKLLHFLGF